MNEKILKIEDSKNIEAGMTFLTDSRKKTILKYANLCSSLEGSMAEFGVAVGGTIIELAKKFTNKTIYAFDTFEGFDPLPKEWFNLSPRFDPKNYPFNENKEWPKSWGKDLPWKKTIEELKKYNNIKIKKGLFPDTTIGLENEKYCFVHIDVDIYSSTLYGLQYFFEKMVLGGAILIDDFYFEKELRPDNLLRFPQVREAIEDYFKNKSENIVKTEVLGQGIIIKNENF